MTKNAKPTIYEVAHKAGVSRQTVSRVINNRPDVASDTRKRILQIIDEMDYRPSAVARSLSKQRTYNFGLLTAGLEFMGPSNTLSGIAKKAEELGYGLYLKELPSFNANNIQPILDWFLARQVDGIIWATPEIGNNRDWIESMIEEIRVPIIFLTSAKRDNISIVAIDNYGGAKMATEHLLNQGRRRIGHISGPMDWWESRQRYQGWADALRGADIEPEERMVAEGNWSSKSGKTAFDELMSKFPEMDAIFSANDQMALSILQTACNEKISIPMELSVVGYDGIPESEFFSPSLTTVFQNMNELGCIAVEELARMVGESNSEEGPGDPIYQTLKTELIIRRSSKIISE
jgi:DNA-binding LacI/PurR family transcriptional regulator